MTCPECNGNTIVERTYHHSDYVERKRKCSRCGLRFLTVEIDSDLYERILRNNDKKRNP